MPRFHTGALPPADRRLGVIVEELIVHAPGRKPYTEPFRVTMYDLRRWEIERIYGSEVVGCEDGEDVVRWRVLIGRNPRYLFQKGTDWFVIPKRTSNRVSQNGI